MNDIGTALVDAAAVGVREKMTKDQFLNCAAVFWDSYVEAKRVMSDKKGYDDAGPS